MQIYSYALPVAIDAEPARLNKLRHKRQLTAGDTATIY